MNNALSVITAILGAIIGLAILSVLISPNAETSNVVGATGNALANILKAATAPVTGAANNGNLGNNANTSVGGTLSGINSGLTSVNSILGSLQST